MTREIEKVPETGIIHCMLRSVFRKIALVWLLAALFVPSVGLCEDEYSAPAKESKKPWMAILYAAVGFAGVLVVGFKHARRTHLD